MASCAQAGENIVALCDPDSNYLAANAKKYPGAKLYTDFRKMLETQKDIDAVTIATPDHVHAVATAMAMKLGKHVHCQKPLTHSVYEARMIGKIARETKVATQMGNFGQAGEEARRVAELIWAGAIGTLKEVHAWSNRNPDISPRGVARPKETPPCPAHLDWDLWVGPAPMRPYHPCYHPFAWRGWWDFGTGVLGDIGCHELSAIFKAMKIGDPVSVEACSTNWQRPKEISSETAPLASITHYRFAASDTHGPLSIFWYDGGMRPPRPEALDPDADVRRERRHHVCRRQGDHAARPPDPREQAEGVRPAAAEAGAVPRALEGVPRRLPGRQTRRLEFRRSRRPPGRSRPAGQHRHPHEPEARMGRGEHEVPELPRGGCIRESAVPAGICTLILLILTDET